MNKLQREFQAGLFVGALFAAIVCFLIALFFIVPPYAAQKQSLTECNRQVAWLKAPTYIYPMTSDLFDSQMKNTACWEIPCPCGEPCKCLECPNGVSPFLTPTVCNEEIVGVASVSESIDCSAAATNITKFIAAKSCANRMASKMNLRLVNAGSFDESITHTSSWTHYTFHASNNCNSNFIIEVLVNCSGTAFTMLLTLCDDPYWDTPTPTPSPQSTSNTRFCDPADFNTWDEFHACCREKGIGCVVIS